MTFFLQSGKIIVEGKIDIVHLLFYEEVASDGSLVLFFTKKQVQVTASAVFQRWEDKAI